VIAAGYVFVSPGTPKVVGKVLTSRTSVVVLSGLGEGVGLAVRDGTERGVDVGWGMPLLEQLARRPLIATTAKVTASALRVRVMFCRC
jgi:hypothetical protein